MINKRSVMIGLFLFVLFVGIFNRSIRSEFWVFTIINKKFFESFVSVSNSADRLAFLGNSSLSPVLRNIDSSSTEVRIIFLDILGRFSHNSMKAYPYCKKYLEDSSAHVREKSLICVNKIIPYDKSYPIVLRCLQDKSIIVSQRAIYILSKFPDSYKIKSVSEILRSLKHHSSKLERYPFIFVLKSINASVIGIVYDWLNSDSSDLRGTAADLITEMKLKNLKIKKKLILNLIKSNVYEKCSTAKALSHFMNDKHVVDLLVYQLGSDEIIEVKCIRKVLIKSKFRRNVFSSMMNLSKSTKNMNLKRRIIEIIHLNK